jgi:hypothetical protein
MPRAAKSSDAAKPARKGEDGARVAVVGGGLAGMSAALRLAERGFQVTLYEAKDRLGGNLASDEMAGVFHDVYPHMFCDWYVNFWRIFEEDLGREREAYFEPRMGIKLLAKGAADYQELRNATTWPTVLDNLRSGVLSPAEMFLTGFAMLDLASHPFNRKTDGQIDRLDVNGFIYSRGYATENVAKLQNYILMVIWSIQSDLTAAASYQDFVRHAAAFPKPTPFAWLLRGDLYQNIIEPLEAKLTALGCDIRKGRAVSGVALKDGRPQLFLEGRRAKGERRGSAEATAPADFVILAAPAPALSRLALHGAPGERIVDVLPQLSELQRFRDTAIPVVDVYFNRVLPGIPKEQVGFTDSDIDLTMLDISQLWTGDKNMEGRTALVLAASNGFALPSADPLEQGHLIIRRLHDYLPVFEPGAHWGDPKADINWAMTHFRSNAGNKLFINDIGSWEWRPDASYPQAPRLFFAGDFCKTDVDMATIEAAVQSGIIAAGALQSADAKARGAMRGAPIALDKHEVASDARFQAAKLALLPAAYAATAWTAFTGEDSPLRRGFAPMPNDAYSPASYALMLPLAFTLDWWKTLYWLVRDLSARPSGGGGPPDGAGANDGPIVLTSEAGATGERARPSAPETLAALAGKALMAAGEALMALAERLPTREDPAAPSNLASALQSFSDQAWRTLQAAASRAPGPDPAPGAYQRRWRVKP